MTLGFKFESDTSRCEFKDGRLIPCRTMAKCLVTCEGQVGFIMRWIPGPFNEPLTIGVTYHRNEADKGAMVNCCPWCYSPLDTMLRKVGLIDNG